jgi:bifunctional enzyme CysN/CysC
MTSSLARLIACGAAGDGKTSLIRRLLDGSRADPRYVVAETPGDEQYARSMIAGAATAEAAVLLVDARKGVVAQTRRHGHLLALLGLRRVALAVNKMDLVDWSEGRFREIERECAAFAQRIGLDDVAAIPVSALHGDNILAPSARMPWHRGATLIGWLEAVEVDEARQQKLPLRFPVQRVNPPDAGSRGFAGTIASGMVRPGDRVRVQPSGKEARVARIVAAGGDLDRAIAGQSVTLVLAEEVDVSPGDLVSAADASCEVADQFEATVVWMGEAPMLRGRSYRMRIGAKTVTATVAPLKYRIDVDTLEHLAAEKLELNEIGAVELELGERIAFDAYADNRETGGFVLIDRLTNHTVGAGMLRFALRRAHNIHVQHVDVDRAARAALKGQRPCVLWLTGLSGAGKSTVANLVEKKLHAMGCHTYLLDGDNVRHGLNKDLGFTAADRVENIRRIAEVAKLMADAGLIVLTAFISPFRAERRMARELMPEGEFIEVFVDAPLDVAEGRDPKGLYKKARRGEIKNFTGIDSPYEPPEAPELRIDTARLTPEGAADEVLRLLARRGLIPGG